MAVCSMGLDIVGPFSKAVGNKKYLLVGTDYFTEWVKAEPPANIKDVDGKRFVWKNIVIRFRVPHVLISDNGLQFDSKMFKRYCGELELLIGILLLLIPKEMDRQKLYIKL